MASISNLDGRYPLERVCGMVLMVLFMVIKPKNLFLGPKDQVFYSPNHGVRDIEDLHLWLKALVSPLAMFIP
jgi:hypothetical protein